MYVARCLDELWIVAIYQSSPELAGSPRNISRYRLTLNVVGVEHWMDVWWVTASIQSNSEYHNALSWDSVRQG